MKSFQWVCCLGIVSLISDIPVHGQILPDNSVGTLLAPNINIQGLPSDVINGGTKNGSNLFHSFQEFNVDAGRGVYFSNPTDVTNIFTRVTGSNASNINGTLGVLGNANLFFLNPNGIFFGTAAKLDVKGSFIGTSANSINFADSTQFGVATTQPSLFTVSVPVGLGFGSNPGKISSRANGQGLQVPTNQSLLLVGGDVAIVGGRLEALDGNIELGGLASSGTVGLSTNGTAMSLSFPEGVIKADVSLTSEGANPAMVNVAGNNGGSIAITANNIDINNSLLRGGIDGLGFTGAHSGDVSLNATGAVNIVSSSILNTLGTKATGNSGNINITAESVAVTNSSKLIASTSGQGNSGSVNINAKESVSFDGSGSTGFSTAVFSNVEPTSVGNSGGINVTAGKISLTNGTSLYSLTSGQGSSGNINVNARSEVALDAVSKNGAFSTILSVVLPTGVGKAGDVNIMTGSLSILDGGQIGAGSYGRGDAGSMNINARNDIIFDGMGNSTPLPTGAFSLIGSPSSQGAIGNSGKINIDTNSLTLKNGAVITTNTFGQGNAGKVNINAREAILVDGAGTNGYPSGIATTVEQQGMGNGGDIEIAAKSLSLMNGAGLVASSRGQGNGGNITVNANTLTGLNGGQILTNSIKSGNAGNITLNATDLIIFAGNDVSYSERLANFGEQRVFAISPASGIFASTSRNSQGQGGDLKIVTGELILTTGAIANVSSEGIGNAGNFNVKADSIKLSNFASFKAENRVGEGGNITLDARIIMLRQNSNITTNATDTATGGNININAGALVALENSNITANALKGRGGNINITTQGIFRDFDSDITATSDIGINGNVDITKPDINQQNNLIEQSSNFGNTEIAIATSCLAKRNIASSKFVVTGNGGLADTPSSSTIQYEAAPIRAVMLNNIQSGQKNTLNSHNAWKLGDSIVEASQLIVSQDGRLLLKAANNHVEPSQNLTCKN